MVEFDLYLGPLSIENRPLSPVLPTGGIGTKSIYSSMRFMQISLYETLPTNQKSYNVANEPE
jgi:hypothetical protein